MLIFGIILSCIVFGWSEPTSSMPSEYKIPLNTSSEDQDVNSSKGKIGNFNADLLDGYDSSDLYAQTGTGYSCPDNYANLCKEGGGLEFVYNGQNMSIDANPRFTGTTMGRWSYAEASVLCSEIGARIPTKEEYQAACTALGGPNGDGMNTFNNSLSSRWEFTSTPGTTFTTEVTSTGSSCSTFSEQAINDVVVNYSNNQNYYGMIASYAWFRCVR